MQNLVEKVWWRIQIEYITIFGIKYIQAFDTETVIHVPEVYQHYPILTINYYFTQVYLRQCRIVEIWDHIGPTLGLKQLALG